MKNVKSDAGYIEGYQWAQTTIKHIDKTQYQTLENAIAVKQKVVDNFEEQFGYSREMDVEKFDYNYSSSVGMLDAFLDRYTGKTT